ncbi:MAG: CARDB domain-containing protein, partial [Bacteroidota bacterium]
VANIGEAKAGASKLCVYLSTDLNFNSNDYLAKTVQIPSLSPGYMAVVDADFDLDDLNLPPGDYYIGIVIDCHDDVHESDEYNNICYWSNELAHIPDPKKPDLECWSRGNIHVDDWDIIINDIKVANTGKAKAAASEVCIYLSTDKTFNSNDILAKTLNVPSLNPGYMAILDANIELMNLDLPPGKYYVGIVIDCDDDVHESDEYNNLCYWDYVIADIPDKKKPDLECWNRGDITIDDWDIVINNIKVANIGEATSSKTEVCVYLSTDLTFDSDDLLVKTLNVPSLTPGYMSILNANIELMDLDMPKGKYYVGLVIDCEDKVMESDEYNNICYWSDPYLEIKDKKKPDLECWNRGDITVDDWDILITDIKVANIGDAKAGASKVCIYLSTDLNFNSNDYLAKELDVPSLEPGYMAVLNANIELMDLDLDPGNYYVGIVIDCHDDVMESDEYNNLCYWDYTIANIPEKGKPDLECGDLGVLNIYNNLIDIDDLIIRNTGDADAGPGRVGIYISENTNITTSDYFLGSVDFNGVDAGESISIDFVQSYASLNLPVDNYFIGIIIDDEEDITESDETNNKCYYDTKLNIVKPGKPDLECGDLGVLNIYNNLIDIDDLIIRNTGDADAGPGRVGIYISENTNITTSDYFLGSVDFNGVDAGESISIDFVQSYASLNLPVDNYFIGIIIDDEEDITESDETNNKCYYDTKLNTVKPGKPDLTCLDRGTLKVSDVTNVLTIEDLKVINNGSGSSQATKVAFYLSTNTNFTNSDILLGTEDVQALAAGQTDWIDFSVDLDNFDIPDGDYFVGIVIDYTFTVSEVYENNNICYFETPKVKMTPKPKPDLTCKSRGELYIDDWDINITNIQVKNVGGASSSNTKVCIYLSTDTNFGNNGDYLVKELYLKGLSANEVEYLNTGNIELMPLNIPYGHYYVGLVIDCGDKVMESNEYNNVCYWDNKVELSANEKPDLTCKSIGTIELDEEELEIKSLKIINEGSESSGSTVVGVYLSSNSTITTDDKRIGEIYLKALNAGSHTTLSEDFDLDDIDLPYGTYYVGVIIDDEENIDEENEGNNICYWSNYISYLDEDLPDLKCKSIGSLYVYDDRITFSNVRVQNNGGSDAGSFKVGFYLSADENFHSERTYLGGVQVDGVNDGRYVRLDGTMYFSDLAISAGTYHIGLVIDDEEEIQEKDEDNNICQWNTHTVTFTTDLLGCNCQDSRSDQICESFERYVGKQPLCEQAECWSTMEQSNAELAASQDAMVNTRETYRSNNALMVDQVGQNVMMKLGDREEGSHHLTLMMYIPEGEMAHLAILNTENPDLENGNEEDYINFEIFFGTEKDEEAIVSNTRNSTFEYPNDRWFELKITMIAYNRLVSTLVNGADLELHGGTLNGPIGALNFKSPTNQYHYYVDDILFIDAQATTAITTTESNDIESSKSTLIADELITPTTEAGVMIYPNPTSGLFQYELNLDKAEDVDIVIYNTMGQIIKRFHHKAVREVRQQINLSEEIGGLYMIQTQHGSKQHNTRLLLNK